MTIHNLAAFIDALWDWACLDGCFPRGIRPTDIDGLVEIKGRFLLIEAKGRGRVLPAGQGYTLKRLSERMAVACPACGHSFSVAARWTVILVWGAPQIPEHIAIWPGLPQPATLPMLRDAVASWATWADTAPPPSETFRWVPGQGI